MNAPSTPYWDRAVPVVKKAVAWLASRPQAEPAVLIGAIGSAAVAAQQALAGANVTTWREAVPVLTGLLIRQFVTSPATRKTLLAVAERALLERIKSQTTTPPHAA